MNQEQQKESRKLRALKETSEIWDAWKGKIAVLAIAGSLVGGGTAATANKSKSDSAKSPNVPEMLGEHGHQSASLVDGESASVELSNGEKVTITADNHELRHGRDASNQVRVSDGHSQAQQPTVEVTAKHK